ncbi:IS5 family transposase [Pseudoroseomonas wenyumeiae]|uniref:IS5 family transposase n=1 Tax=Teichococcus wenyumeiae TaxID=2478470 RepID=A0A3A9J8K0_9PROT|nr:IS5 family transposase [Pseudoroseomonas wenyumeiae]RKK01053.1 IS5 family transposase [Pseudoroseomonas wenyumeiae]RMI14498.1 IS5 family transposase [Pseudoroseomonas wenyumeiae]
MAKGKNNQLLTDAVWAVWEPLIEEVRPRGKTPPKELRRTISAILWRHQNGAKWRSIPDDLGPWWLAAQLFIRWAKAGVWERLLELVQQQGVALGMTFLDGTNIRAHHKAAGAGKKGAHGTERDLREALGRSRGGYGTKACVIADGRGRAIAFALAPGQAHELPLAPGLLNSLPDVPGWIVGDRGYASDAFRERIWNMGARPAIPPKRTDAPVACPAWIYNNRSRVENLWARLKEWRAVATRYEKTARSFLSILCLAAADDWIKI